MESRMRNDRRVVVTGLGAVSPYGIGVDVYWQGLLSGISRIAPVASFDNRGYRSILGAAVPEAVSQQAESQWNDRATGFMAMAVQEALSMAHAGPVFKSTDRVGCVLGSLCAGIDNLIRVADAYHNDRKLLASFQTRTAQVNYQLQLLANAHNFTGPTSMVSTACASTTDAIGYGADLIRHGECDAVVVGGGDTLAELIHAGFNSLFSITTTEPRPFDTGRDGFAIGEGGGALYLETLERALARGAKPLVEIKGYGLSNTAFHLTATSDDGSGEALAVGRALADAGLKATQVDYINTHGTATRHNDQSEMQAIQRIFGEHTKHILASSNKPMIGHCMGAAGAMEAISTVLTLLKQTVPPTPYTRGDEPLCAFDLVTGKPRSTNIRHAISESFGFGGACSCAVFSALDAA